MRQTPGKRDGQRAGRRGRRIPATPAMRAILTATRVIAALVLLGVGFVAVQLLAAGDTDSLKLLVLGLAGGFLIRVLFERGRW